MQAGETHYISRDFSFLFLLFCKHGDVTRLVASFNESPVHHRVQSLFYNGPDVPFRQNFATGE